ncbi:MAG: phosphoribosylaminoimidazolesuccinocarboxamide synthase [Candidatus Bathyarchaeia archaeon]
MHGLVELTLKDDELDAKRHEIQTIRCITKEVNQILLEYLCKLNLVLVDFKVESGIWTSWRYAGADR